MSDHGVDRNASPAAAAAAVAASTPGSATGVGAVVVGPGSSTDNAIVLWDGTTGLLVQDSSTLLTDLLLIVNIDDVPVNGETSAPISSNWAYDHENAADPHTGYVLESAIGTTVQAYDAELAAIAALAVTDGNIIVGNGSTWVAESGATARTSLGLGTGDSPEFTAVNVGAASDTTLARAAAGVVAVEGKNLTRITSQSGAPSSTPTYVGELNIDTTGAKAYVSTGTASSADWEQIDGTAGGAGASSDINQSTHGFAVGDLTYYTGSAYAKAKADAAATAEVIGIVSAVADTDNFTLLYIGAVTGLSGLTAGTVYFLSASSAGAMTATEPTTTGYISKPVFVATSTTAGVFFNYRGATVGSATSTLAQSIQSGDNSTTAFTLPATPVSENNVLVFISGVWQQRDTYSVSGATLTFSTAPPTGTSNIEFIVIGSVSIGTASATDAGATLTLGTEQASTSGTTIDFTGIPSGTKQIIVTLRGVSTNGTSDFLVQIGDSGGIEATSYVSYVWQGGSGDTLDAGNTTGFSMFPAHSAASNYSGTIVINLVVASTFKWQSSGNVLRGDGAGAQSYGLKSLSAELDRIRITSVSADTFDAGSINIAYK